MDFPTISNDDPRANIDEQLNALDATIAASEEILKDTDDAITASIDKRGKLAEQIQHLWMRRHHLNNDFQRIREKINGRIPFKFP